MGQIFDIELEKKAKISLKEELEEDEVATELGEYFNVFEMLKKLYSWITLQSVSKGKEYISEAFIEKYDKYKSDLALLKEVYRELLPEKYNEMFRKKDVKNYKGYNDNISKCSWDDMRKTLLKDFETIEMLEDKRVNRIKNDLADVNFLIKLRNRDNGEIPNQLHAKELEIIMINQAKYHSTIAMNQEKILQLMKFRIPYYVGPLNRSSKEFAWIIKNEGHGDTKILPWNFDKVVNRDKTAEEFIKRMLNKCTYLSKEDVIPKNSLLYSEYCVLNELNKITINDEKIKVSLKNKVLDGLFKTQKKITEKTLKEFLLKEHEYTNIEKIEGFQKEKEFASSLSSYNDMRYLFGEINETNITMIEDIIGWITIFEDRKVLRERIKNIYPEVNNETIKKIVKLPYTGWSALSIKLLLHLKSFDNESIMDILRNTNLNFMQIINEDKFGINKQIEEAMPKLETEEITYEDVHLIPGSPAIKRGIWQSIKIINEIIKIQGNKPKNIIIEFARDEGKKKRVHSRVKQLKDLYEKLNSEINDFKTNNKNVYDELKKFDNNDSINEKLYLYFIQQGKCLYSGKSFNFETLIQDSEVDHIMPRTYIKDDSLANKALVYRNENQRKTDDLILDKDIINNMKPWWYKLKQYGLIEPKKLYRLTRENINTDEKEGFINRQLVETRQISKHVANLLNNQYKDEVNIYTIRGELTSDFRKKNEIYKNRNINDMHHAQDAYIISVIGNFIDQNFTKGKDKFKYDNYFNFVKGEDKFVKNKYKYPTILYMMDSKLDINRIRKTAYYKDAIVTKMLEENTGEFYNQNILSKDKIKTGIPIKTGLDTLKYGGYSGENNAYSAIIKYITSKGKDEAKLVGIPVRISYLIKQGKITLEEYLQNEGYNQVIILKRKVLNNQVFRLDKYEFKLISNREIKTNKQLILPKNYQRIVMNMNKKYKTDIESREIESIIIELFHYLLEKIQNEYNYMFSVVETLSKKEDMFLKFEIDEKIICINKIIEMMKSQYANLSVLKESTALGRQFNKNFNRMQLKNMIFIDYSVTGLYERRYKLDELENNSNK